MADKMDLNQVGADLLKQLLSAATSQTAWVGDRINEGVSSLAQAGSQSPSMTGIGGIYAESVTKAYKKQATETATQLAQSGTPYHEAMAHAEEADAANTPATQAPAKQADAPVSASSAMQNGVQGIAPSATTPNQESAGSGIQAPTINPATGAFSRGGLDQQGNLNEAGIGMAVLQTLLPGIFPDKATRQLSQQSILLDNAMKKQELTGNKPYQKGSKEEQELKGQQAYATARATADATASKPMVPEAAAKFSALLEGRDATNTISQMLLGGDAQGTIVGNKFTPNFFKSDAIRKYNSALEIAIQQKNRAETGAGFGKTELPNILKRYQPRVGDSISTIKSRLKPLYGYFDRAIQVADPKGIHQARAGQAEVQAVEQNSIAQALLAEKQRRKGSR